MSDMIITTPKVPSTSFSSGKTNHSKLSGLDFDSSGHTGFQRELTQEQLENIDSIPNKANADEVYTKDEVEERLAETDIEIGENGNWYIGGEDTGNPSRGESGLIPRVILFDTTNSQIPYVNITANTMTVIDFADSSKEYNSRYSISLGSPVTGYDNEWDFQIIQGDTPAEVSMGFAISWGLGIAPTFAANTTTICRLYYAGDTLCGEWTEVSA